MTAKPSSHIIAIGGGFLAPARNAALARYVLRQANASNPRVCFIPTASGDRATAVARFYRTFSALRCRPTHLPFFARTPDPADLLLAQDVICVGGGNTKSMLAVWDEWGLPRILRQAWRRGIVLAGASAGAICWFDTGVTDSWESRLRLLPCLGFLGGTCCPHYDGEAERRPAVHALVAAGAVPHVLALDDGVGAHFVGRRLTRVVSARARGGAYRVHRKNGGVVETLLQVIRLV